MTLRRAYNNIDPGSITDMELADGVVPQVVRRGALFGPSDAVATVSWGPTTTSMTYECRVQYKATGTEQALMGRGIADRPAIVISSGGQILLRNGGGTLLYTVPGVLVDGAVLTCSFEISATSTTITLNGAVMVVAYTAQAWATTATTVWIGALNTAGASQSSSTLSDVRLIDPASYANTAYFPLDGLDASGNFPNEHPGSTVADATVTGFIQFAEVLGQSGKPVPVGRACFLHSATRIATSPVMDGSVASSHDLTFDTAGVEETDSLDYATGVFTAPSAGVVVLQAHFSVQNGGAVTELANLVMKKNTAQVTLSEHWMNAGLRESLPLAGMTSAVGGDEIKLRLENIDSANTFTHRYSTVTIRFYPD